jgi:hypothetical protein
MDRRKFFVGSAALLAAYLGQRYFLDNPLGKLFAEEPVYEGNIDVAVGRFIYMPGTNVRKNLTGIVIVEEGFDSSKVLEKQVVIYGKERKDVITREMTGFVQVDRIKAKDGSEIYRRAENKNLMGSDFPSRKLMDGDKYLSPKNFTYKNEDAWKKLGTNKIKLIGTFSPDYQFIYVKDEKDGKTNKIKVERIGDWIKYQLQSKFELEKSKEDKYGYGNVILPEISICAIIKNTADAKERTRTRELFSVDVNYILPEMIREEFNVSAEPKKK